ncbi:hypothetical protein [Micromonospora sp. NPDC023737]|uniref:hypothetical protein n=1 Tax=unclassified Micromonospora TaxID=2617518 RepID=UPI0033D6084C
MVATDELRANQEFEVSASVFAEGGSPAEDVAVRLPLPPTVEFLSVDAGGPAWAWRLKATTDRFVECTRDHWDIATDRLNLQVRLRPSAGLLQPVGHEGPGPTMTQCYSLIGCPTCGRGPERCGFSKVV